MLIQQPDFQNMTMQEFADWELEQLCIEHDKLIERYNMENILVFKTELLGENPFQGFTTNEKIVDNINNILKSDQLFFMQRDIAENNPDYKQVIPYCIINNMKNEILVYERSNKGGETRLHNMHSLGIGGHINPIDGEELNPNTYINALRRELKEEMGISGPYYIMPIGVLNDDSNDVGKVHIGMVNIIATTPETQLKFEDKALLNARFEEVEWIKENKDKFENWSKLIIENI